MLREVAQISDGRLLTAGAFHPNNEELLLLDGFGSTPQRWSLKTGGFVPFPRELPPDFVASNLACSSTHIAIAGRGREFVFNATTWALEHELVHDAGDYGTFVMLGRTRPLLITGQEETIVFWTLAPPPVKKRIRRPDGVGIGREAALTADDRFLVLKHYQGNLRRLDVDTWEEVRTPSTLERVHATTRGSEVLTVHPKGVVERWDIAKLEKLGTVQFAAERGPTSFDPLGVFAATCEPVEKQRLVLYDAKTGAELEQSKLRTRGDHTHEAWSRDGRHLLVIGYDTRLYEVQR